MPTNKNALIIMLVVIVVVAGATIVAAVLGTGSEVSQTQTVDDASSTVEAFGQTLQQVSIMAPDASSTIASVYAPYVDESLLAQWEAAPQSAPGRVVSSPWPDHIQIDSISPQGTGYVVNGELVFMSSTGSAGTTPVVIQLADENGTLMIVAFEGQSSS